MFILQAAVPLIDRRLSQYTSRHQSFKCIQSMDGRYFSTDSFEGEQTLLMFWAPWCGVCQRKLPQLAQYYRETVWTEVQILTLGTADPSDRGKEYVDKHSGTFTFPASYDDGGLLKETFRIKADPTYALLDVDGTIQMIHRGSGILRNRLYQSLVE
ncbi:MAG: TlpA disulfide reductase family protein [Nitrospirales bacterium]